MKLGYSRDTQKLIYWIIADYGAYLANIELKWKQAPDDYFKGEAKKDAKKRYLQAIEYEPSEKPLDDYRAMLENKDNLTVEQLQWGFVKALNDFLALHDDFSLALKSMSQKQANRFVKFLFSFMLDHDIPMRHEIVSLYHDSKEKSFAYQLLKKKKCCICGGEVKFPHHHKSVAYAGGYKNDKGDLPIAPLCQYHHAELHDAIDRNKWIAEHHNYTFLICNSQEKEEMQRVYKGLFSGYDPDDDLEIGKEREKNVG